MDRVETKILVAVAAKSGENPDRRMGQGSSAMFVSRGSVGPKTYLNRSTPDGKQVNIPVPLFNAMWGRRRLTQPGVGSPGSSV